MQGLGWIAAIIVGALAGWIAEKLMKSDHGLLMNIILGILGAVIMNFLLVTLMGATLGGWLGQLAVGVLGACILIGLGRALRR
ncbi:GlsB/YeaQ/YmgE family stress response membrane protein [Falsirhodobacter xinxiangensis]|uniref:GlsB/YeaQ/YmgE family stress response membrane protein n=1 Tax=Falsirhodobacter xinxiangensis TaxID=2530049 RepID=UPI0010A9D38A|nr:GlsB/YeaQ/YmgE family stress response membrane protein [Rhodobacter xinxiangensis]